MEFVDLSTTARNVIVETVLGHPPSSVSQSVRDELREWGKPRNDEFCHCCGDVISELDEGLTSCDGCENYFCLDCEPYREDDSPTDLCNVCLSHAE